VPNPSDPDLLSTRVYKYGLYGTNGMARATDPERGRWFYLESSGPDRFYHNMSGVLYSMTGNSPLVGRLIYDPTNGTISNGSIWRVGGQKTAFYVDVLRRSHFYDMVVVKIRRG
jgi:hypothetical protein